MINVPRAATAAAVGILSGAAETQADIVNFPLLGGNVGMDAVVEGVALIGAAALAWLSPQTNPDMVDGAFEGSLALMAKRGVANGLVMAKVPLKGTTGRTYMGERAFRANALRSAEYGSVNSPSAGGVIGRGYSTSPGLQILQVS